MSWGRKQQEATTLLFNWKIFKPQVCLFKGLSGPPTKEAGKYISHILTSLCLWIHKQSNDVSKDTAFSEGPERIWNDAGEIGTGIKFLEARF